MARTLWAAIP